MSMKWFLMGKELGQIVVILRIRFLGLSRVWRGGVVSKGESGIERREGN